jgi:hypothetical protein
VAAEPADRDEVGEAGLEALLAAAAAAVAREVGRGVEVAPAVEAEEALDVGLPLAPTHALEELRGRSCVGAGAEGGDEVVDGAAGDRVGAVAADGEVGAEAAAIARTAVERVGPGEARASRSIGCCSPGVIRVASFLWVPGCLGLP